MQRAGEGDADFTVLVQVKHQCLEPALAVATTGIGRIRDIRLNFLLPHLMRNVGVELLLGISLCQGFGTPQ